MNLLKTVASVSGLTLLSRITGLIRELLTASVFGASAVTDAFFVAFRLPNLLRRLVAEGAFSQAFIPVLGAVKKEGQDQAERFISRMASLLFWVLCLITLIGVIGAPLLVWAIAGGFTEDASIQALTVSMTRWMFPYILMIALVSLASGILNTWGEFKTPAFGPVLLNLSFIAAALVLAPRLQEPVWALVAAVVVGGILQLAISAWALAKRGLLPRISFSILEAWRDSEVRKTLGLMVPAALAVSVAQVSLIINTNIASRLGPGSVSWLSYADRLMEFPTAMLGVALGTVLLPSLAKAHASADANRYSALLDWGLRLTLLMGLPAAVALAILAEPLVASLFHYGRFDDQDVPKTALALTAYAVGLMGLVGVKILAPGFYARQDTKTPMRIALAVLVTTQALNIVTVPWLSHAGLALSISLAALMNAALLLIGLIRRGIYKPEPGWFKFALTIVGASCLMACVLVYAVPEFDWIALRATPGLRLTWLFAIILAAASSYFIVLLGLGIRPRHFLIKP